METKENQDNKEFFDGLYDINSNTLKIENTDGHLIKDIKYDPNNIFIEMNQSNLQSLINANSAWSNVSSYPRESECTSPKVLEVKKTNGNRTVIDLSKQKIEDITEVSYRVPRLSMKFPFVKLEKRKYTKITVSDYSDKKRNILKIDCNLKMMMKILDMDYSSWSVMTMTENVKNGI